MMTDLAINRVRVLERVLGIEGSGTAAQLSLGAYKTAIDGEIEEHALLFKGPLGGPEPHILRINSACLTGDIFGDTRCDCSWQLQESLRIIRRHGGLLIYHFAHEGRGAGYTSKLRSYNRMQADALTTFEAFIALGLPPDQRTYLHSIAVLRDLGVLRVRLLTNNPEKSAALERHGIEVVETLPLISKARGLDSYLDGKRRFFGHNIPERGTS